MAGARKKVSGVRWPKPEKDLEQACKKIEEKEAEIGEFTRKAFFAKKSGSNDEYKNLLQSVHQSLLGFDQLLINKRRAEIDVKLAREFSRHHDRWAPILCPRILP